MYLSKKYVQYAVNKVNNAISITKTYFGHICLKIWVNEEKKYFKVHDSPNRFNPPKTVTALTKEECLEALDIIQDYHTTLFKMYENIWDDNLKDYHKSLNSFIEMHKGYNKLPMDEQDKIGKIADIVFEITSDFSPLAGIGASVLNATRAAQYYVVYSMESQENI